jgi:DNA-binding response OmpR family regulator
MVSGPLVLTHRHLLRQVWGPAQADEVQYLRVFIRGLRQKLEPRPDPSCAYPDRVRCRLPPAASA